VTKSSRYPLFVLLQSLIIAGIVCVVIWKQKPTHPVLTEILNENNPDYFSDIGATQKFAQFVWKETIKSFPAASNLKMPKVHFTASPSKKLGYTDSLYGVYLCSEQSVVVFVTEHVGALGVDLSLDEGKSAPSAIIQFLGKKDVQGHLGVTLVHEFKHHILHASQVRSTRHHQQMLHNKDMFKLMKRVAGSVSNNSDIFLKLEKDILETSVAKDLKEELTIATQKSSR